MTKKLEFIPAVLMGSAIGDALGMPFEMRGSVMHPDLKDWNGEMRAGTSHALPMGHYTDDTEMAVALATSLCSQGGFDRNAVSNAYLEWYKDKPTGVGGTVRKSMKFLEEYMQSEWHDSGQKFEDPEAVGSGTVMRAAPIGAYYSDRPDMIRWACRQDAYITHAHPEAYAASLAVASLVAGIIKNHRLADKGMEQASAAVGFMFAQLATVASSSLTFKAFQLYIEQEGWLASPGDIADSLAGRWGSAWQIAVTAIHCALSHMGPREDGNGSFEGGVLAAVRLGGDTDTRGAVTGAILGAKYGTKAIPTRWVDAVRNRSLLQKIDLTLANPTRPSGLS